MGVLKELFSRPLYHDGKMGDEILPAPAQATNDVQPTEYGMDWTAEDFERKIDENPLDATAHLIAAGWYDENHPTGPDGQSDEGAFKRALGAWLQTDPLLSPNQRWDRDPRWQDHASIGSFEEYPWAVSGHFSDDKLGTSNYPAGVRLFDYVHNEPGTTSHGIYHSVLPDPMRTMADPIPLEVARWTPGIGPEARQFHMSWRTFRDMENSLRSSFMHQRGKNNSQPTQASRYERRHAPTNLTYADKPYRTGQFIPGTVMFTHTPKGIPERWRPTQDVNDVQPTEYGDVEDLEAAVRQAPHQAHLHGVLADALSDRHAATNDPNDAMAADFRRAMMDWLHRQRPDRLPSEHQSHWAAPLDDYPVGVNHEHLPGANWGFPIQQNGVWTPVHWPINDWLGGRLIWPSYPAMETAFWEAFGKGRGVEGPEDVQPTEYGDVIPVSQVTSPHVLAHRRETGAAKMRRLTERRAAQPVEANAERVLAALRAHGPLKRSDLLNKTKVYGQAFHDALAHLGEQLNVERRGAHPNGGGPPTEVWSIRAPEQAINDVQPTEYASLWDVPEDPPRDGPGADLGFPSDPRRQPPEVSAGGHLDLRPSDPIPGQSPYPPPIFEHLNVLNGGAGDSAFPNLARAYLGAIPPNERDAVYRAIGVDPLGPDPHLHLASIIGGDRHRRPEGQIGTAPPDAPPTVQAAEPGWDTWQPSTPEQEGLHYANVTAEEPVGVRSANETLKVTLDNGQQGIFKPHAGEKPGLRDGIDHGTQWRREVAASDVARILGFGDLVPPTAFRAHAGRDGSLQQFVPDAMEARTLTDHYRYDGDDDAARAAVFDYLIGNTDRHPGNWLVRNGKLALIDNGLSFPHTIDHSDFLNTDFWQHASWHNLAMPNVLEMRDKWPEVEAALETAGLEHTAIAYAKWRYDQVTSGNYWTIGQLPAFWDGSNEPMRNRLEL